jgi:hypothetical protein
MTSKAQNRNGRFFKVGWGFHDLLVGSRVFLPSRWMMLTKVPGVGAMRRWFYLAAKPPHTGVGVDGLTCPVHHPMACSCQTRGHGLLPDAVLSCRCSGRWHLPGDVKLPGRGYLM